MIPAIREQIREFVQEIANSKGVSSFTDKESLLENGVVESLTIFRLVSFLEDTFRLRIPDEDIISENFESVERIEQFVMLRQKKAG